MTSTKLSNMRPPFNTFPILKNERILLRELRDSDIQHLIEISFYQGTPANDLLEAQMMNGRIKLDYESGESIHWVIVSVLDGEVLGNCGFYRGFRNDFGEIGYVLKKAHQGKGYITEAVSLMLAYGWQELKLKGIKAITSSNNQASINVLKRAGLKQVATDKDEVVFLIRNQA